MHCVARQNKLETPRDKDEVNKREIAGLFRLLWIVKARAKDKKLYMDVGVMKG